MTQQPALTAGNIVASLQLPGNRTFQVVVHDLLGEPVDAIVNAANGGLSHGGGVAAAIAISAGSQLVLEGDTIIRRQGRIPTGEAVVTTAGDLPFKGIIHAVGPINGEGQELEKLTKAVFSSLLRAHEKGWYSISFPAISSGIFSVPLPVCAEGYCNGVLSFFQTYPSTSLKIIRLCVFNGPIIDCMVHALEAKKSQFHALPPG